MKVDKSCRFFVEQCEDSLLFWAPPKGIPYPSAHQVGASQCRLIMREARGAAFHCWKPGSSDQVKERWLCRGLVKINSKFGFKQRGYQVRLSRGESMPDPLGPGSLLLPRDVKDLGMTSEGLL